jgi:hypothetical protein
MEPREEQGYLGHLQEISAVGRYESDTLHEVAVFEYAGPNPHLHVWWGAKRPEDAKPDCHVCVRLDRPEYFIHEGKTGVFHSKTEEAALIEFLGAQHKSLPGSTNFGFAVALWNASNPDWEIPSNLPMPDYTRLPWRGGLI